jgi:hypothetical protein
MRDARRAGQVKTLLYGNFADSWTTGSNKMIIATETQKNTVYQLAKVARAGPACCPIVTRVQCPSDAAGLHRSAAHPPLHPRGDPHYSHRRPRASVHPAAPDSSPPRANAQTHDLNSPEEFGKILAAHFLKK